MSFEDQLLYFDKDTCEYYDNLALYEIKEQYYEELTKELSEENE